MVRLGPAADPAGEELLGRDGGFFGNGSGAGVRAGLRVAVVRHHLAHIGDAFPALRLAPHAGEEPRGRANAVGESLLDLLLGKSVADADIHDRLNPADVAQWLEQLRMSVNRLVDRNPLWSRSPHVPKS